MVVAAFKQEKALVGAFSVITNLRMDLFEALAWTQIVAKTGGICPAIRSYHRHHRHAAHYTLSLFATLNRFVKSSRSLHHSAPALSWEASLNFATGHGRYERAAHKKGHKSHDKNGRGLIFTNCRIVVTSDQP